jgi:peptide/nickel transport system ATP-binding protein
MPTGCAFHPRCPKAFDPCRTDLPLLTVPADRDLEDRTGADRTVACWLHPGA